MIRLAKSARDELTVQNQEQDKAGATEDIRYIFRVRK